MSPSPDTALATRFVASANHNARRAGLKPNSIVLHYTGMRTGEGALARLCEPAVEVSSHYLVWEDGSIDQLVPEARRAWHAGASFWKGETDLNSASIGIEIVNPGHDGGSPPFADAQIEAVIALCRDICGRWSIPPERVLAHSDIAPLRKRDPGEVFPWERLWRAGVGHWTMPRPTSGPAVFRPHDEGPPVRALQAMLALYGYGVEITGVYDRNTSAAITAFQRRFRPERVDGEADASTLATLKALIDELRVPLPTATGGGPPNA